VTRGFSFAKRTHTSAMLLSLDKWHFVSKWHSVKTFMRRKAEKARGNEKRGCPRQNVFHCAAYFIAGDLRNCQQIMDLTHFLEKICYSCSQWKNYPLESANQLTNQPRNQFIHTLLAFRLIYLKLAFSHSNARRRFSSEAVKRSNAMPLDFACVWHNFHIFMILTRRRVT